jgi:hypothetical protein
MAAPRALISVVPDRPPLVLHAQIVTLRTRQIKRRRSLNSVEAGAPFMATQAKSSGLPTSA